MTTATFLAQVSNQIELGYPGEAITRLTVMLDLAADNDASLVEARRALLGHPVFAMLAQEPAMAIARSCGQDRINRLVSQICAPQSAPALAANAVVLSQIMAASSFHRAIRARVKHAGEMLTRAWQDGRTIALLGDSFDAELAGLRGRDLSNLTITASTPERAQSLAALLGPSVRLTAQNPAQWLADAAGAGASFDLVYLPRAAEALDAVQLAVLLDQARQVLAPAGSIVAPAFLAGRIARGWQQACLDWPVQDHTEAALTAACPPESLTIRMLGDQAGCFVWLIASQPAADHIKREERA